MKRPVKNNLKKAALAYAKQGWPVFPIYSPLPDGKGCTCSKGTQCQNVGKHPRTANGFKDATTDVKQINEWWAHWPDANIGIPTGGTSGLLVLDIDKKHGGLNSLKKLVKLHGKLKTLYSRTGSGGFHGVFQYPKKQEIRNATGILPGLDIRGEGGYIVAPPSRHASGKRYQWIDSTTNPMPIPDWLLKLISKPKSTTATKKIGVITAGHRNDRLFRSGCALRAQGWDLDEIYDRLLILNAKRCRPPLSDDELKIIAESAAKQKETIAETLQKAGFDRLQKGASDDDIENVMRALAKAFDQCDAIRRASLREAAIKELKQIQAHSPAKLVNAALVQRKPGDSQHTDETLTLSEPEPWATPIKGAVLATNIEGIFKQHLVLMKGAPTALTLWVFHTYLLDAADISPILGIISPVKRCGKTLTLDLLETLTLRPLSASSITTAATFRAIDAYRPTLLIDEADTYLKQNDELRGVLNSGHRKSTAVVVRAVSTGNDYVPRVFKTFAAKAIALIGKLPATLEDRAIILSMSRKRADEKVERLDRDLIAEKLEEKRRKIARWAHDNLASVKKINPSTLPDLNDRAKDNWRPLLAIAEALGGEWPQKAHEAALLLSQAADEGDSSAGIQLLDDLKDVFERMNTDFLSSSDIVDELKDMEERPWPEWKNGKPMTATQVAALLKPFGIKPKVTWIKGSGLTISRSRRGYRKKDCQDAFSRYLPPVNP